MRRGPLSGLSPWQGQRLWRVLRGTGTDQQVFDNAGIEEVTVVGAMSHMCIDAATRAASDLCYATTVLHDACATRDLEFIGEVVPAAQVHNVYMSTLASAYAKVIATDEYLAAAAA